MKKIAFMFAAAALFAACGGATEKPAAEEVENAVEEVVAEVTEACELADSVVWAKVVEVYGDTANVEADTLAARFEAAKAELKAACEGACCQESEDATETTTEE